MQRGAASRQFCLKRLHSFHNYTKVRIKSLALANACACTHTQTIFDFRCTFRLFALPRRGVNACDHVITPRLHLARWYSFYKYLLLFLLHTRRDNARDQQIFPFKKHHIFFLDATRLGLIEIVVSISLMRAVPFGVAAICDRINFHFSSVSRTSSPAARNAQFRRRWNSLNKSKEERAHGCGKMAKGQAYLRKEMHRASD